MKLFRQEPLTRDIRDFLTLLEKKGQLKRISNQVDSDLEIAAISDRVLGMGGPALLFENVKGSSIPVAVNLLGTMERVVWSLVKRCHENDIPIALVTSSSFESFRIKTAPHQWMNLFSVIVLGDDKLLAKGKPAASDLQSGYLTAPVFYALEENPALSKLINAKFSQKDDLAKALSLVRDSSAIKKSRELAEKFASESKDSISWLPDP